jgi:hypothetical protein
MRDLFKGLAIGGVAGILSTVAVVVWLLTRGGPAVEQSQANLGTEAKGAAPVKDPRCATRQIKMPCFQDDPHRK